jgi:hypothetical protein
VRRRGFWYSRCEKRILAQVRGGDDSGTAGVRRRGFWYSRCEEERILVQQV